MALIRRLGLAVLVLIAVLYPMLDPASPVEQSESERRMSRMYLLRSRMDQAASRWEVLAERDSSAIPARHWARPGKPEVRLRGYGTAPLAAGVTKSMEDLWTWLGPVDSTVKVAVVIYNGDPYRVGSQRWRSYRGASISTGDGTTTCVALLHGMRLKDGSVSAVRESLHEALGPCLLLAGFGPPGPVMQRWLDGTRYAAAGSTAWLNRSRSFIDGGRGIPPPWFGFWGYDGSETPYSGLLMRNAMAQSIAEMLAPPYELGVYGLRCTAGDEEACRIGVLDSTLISEGTRDLPRDLAYATSLLEQPRAWALEIPRPPGEWWLSDLIRDQGREKFARFWKSSAPFERGFREAFGEDLGAWTHRWSVRQWENSWFEKYRHSPRLLGSTLRPSWLALALAWTGVALMLTAWVARRRQVA